MLWDKHPLTLMPASGAQSPVALRYARPGCSGDGLTAALTYAGFVVSCVTSSARLLERIQADRPDLVMLSGVADPQAGLLDSIETACSTETLPVLLEHDHALAWQGRQVTCDAIPPGAAFSGSVLVSRALVRRVRPWCLGATRRVGALEFNEARFQLAAGGRVASLGVMDFNILGCLFDAPEHTFDRETLLRLVIGPRGAGQDTRSIDAKICATRNLLISALQRDPIETVRGVGYRLAPSE